MLQESVEPNGSSDIAFLFEKPSPTQLIKVDPALAARLSELRAQIDLMFEQDSGAGFVVRARQIGDNALIGMRGSAHLGERILAGRPDAHPGQCDAQA